MPLSPDSLRAYWVRLRDPGALRIAESRALLRDSHARVLAGRPRKLQRAIAEAVIRPRPVTRSACEPRGATHNKSAR